jgi:hypothetical protein
MPSLPFPWAFNTYPNASVIPGMVIGAGSFTTDSAGNVQSVSGMFPGMAISGTSLSSGVYTFYIGDGPVTNEKTAAGIGQTTGCGELVSRRASASILFASAEVVQSGQAQPLPTSWQVQALARDAVAASGQFQFLQSTVTVPIASGQFVSTPFKPALFANGTAQVVYAIQTFKRNDPP